MALRASIFACGSKGRLFNGKQSGASQTCLYFQQLGLDSHKKRNNESSHAPLYDCIRIYKHYNESNLSLHPLSYVVNCPDSLLRNKAKNALSLAMPFSLGLTGAKINKIWIGQGDEVKIVYFYTKFVEIRCKLNFLTFAAQNGKQ